jgi:hypothetical protein
MYFDVWAMKQSMAKVFDRVIDRPKRSLAARPSSRRSRLKSIHQDRFYR